VKSPVQWLVASARMLERELPPPWFASDDAQPRAGSVRAAERKRLGWRVSWITTNNLLARYNEAATLVKGDVSTLAGTIVANNPDVNRMVDRRMKRQSRQRGCEKAVYGKATLRLETLIRRWRNACCNRV